MIASQIRIWTLAARPKTLGAAFAPVVMGTALAHADGKSHWLAAACALAGALLIQIGTNYANDYFDFVKGTDTEERQGPQRMTQSGMVTPRAMRLAATLAFALALIPGAYVIFRGGTPLLVVGLLSIALGILYTGGPFPLGYIGLADIAVLIFFGPVAVAGTYYVQALTLSTDALIAGLAPGFISVALLTINNLRDIDTDRKAGKRSLPVRFGAESGRAEYAASMLIACLAVPLYFYVSNGSRLYGLLALGAAYIAMPLIMTLLREPPSAPMYNRLLARTGAILPLYAIAFALIVICG